MSDSTIDDAIRLLEVGKGNPDRLKEIIKSFQERSMISMQDRKYVDALVEQYLTPRHRQITRKTNTIEKQKKFPRIRKGTESSFKITEVRTTSGNSNIKPSTDREVRITSGNSNIKPSTDGEVTVQKREELASRESTIEEKFIEHVDSDRTSTKKSGKGKIIGIVIGIIAVIIIGGGAAYMGSSSDLFLSDIETENRITCQDSVILVASTKIPGFPDPEKDLQHYLDRYENEPTYKEWFDKNFQGQTVKEVLVPQKGDKEIIVPGFPDPEKDLQHYLDRYENEPTYKEWFDKNFQGQTVKEAVC